MDKGKAICRQAAVLGESEAGCWIGYRFGRRRGGMPDFLLEDEAGGVVAGVDEQVAGILLHIAAPKPCLQRNRKEVTSSF